MCDVQQVLRGLLVCGVNASFGLDGPTSVILIQIESSPHVLRGTEETTAARVLLLCLNAMAGLLELEPAAAPATVLESESTGRERGGQGGSILVSTGMGDGGGLWRPRRPWSCRPGARGQLSTGSNREKLGLEYV